VTVRPALPRVTQPGPGRPASPHNRSGQKEIAVTAARQITQFTCKQDMSRWTRAHADTPGINWSVYPGPGGTMIVIEHEEDRSTFLAAQNAQAA
jgi:hypothetical protein